MFKNLINLTIDKRKYYNSIYKSLILLCIEYKLYFYENNQNILIYLLFSHFKFKIELFYVNNKYYSYI